MRGNACGRVRGVAGARERGHVREWVRASVGADVGARVSARCAFVPFVSLFVSLLCVACVECSTWNISRIGVVFTCTRCVRVSCIGSKDTFNENVL